MVGEAICVWNLSHRGGETLANSEDLHLGIPDTALF